MNKEIYRIKSVSLNNIWLLHRVQLIVGTFFSFEVNLFACFIELLRSLAKLTVTSFYKNVFMTTYGFF